MKILDETGLSTLWNKIKEYFASKTDVQAIQTQIGDISTALDNINGEETI